jgi:hypothetical protein
MKKTRRQLLVVLQRKIKSELNPFQLDVSLQLG